MELSILGVFSILNNSVMLICYNTVVLYYRAGVPWRSDNTPHVASAASIISQSSREVLIVPNSVFVLHLRVKNLVLPRSKFSKAFTINAQLLAVPFR